MRTSFCLIVHKVFYMRTTEKIGSQSATTKIKLIVDETIYDGAKPGDEHKAKAMDAVVQICEGNTVVKSIPLLTISPDTSSSFFHVNAAAPVEVHFTKANKTIAFPEAMRSNFVTFLKSYQKGDGRHSGRYDCVEFAVEMATGREHAQSTCIATAAAYDEKKAVGGEVVYLVTQEKHVQRHVAVYLGHQCYLSKFGADGPLAITTLTEMKKAYPLQDCLQLSSIMRNPVANTSNTIEVVNNSKLENGFLHLPKPSHESASWNPLSFIIPAFLSGSQAHGQTTSFVKTAVFKLRDDIHGPKDWIPSALVNPKEIASKKQDACTVDDTYLYIITEDEKLLITRNNTLDVMLEGGVNRVTHAQIAKHAKDGLVRAAGMIFWDAKACKWVANNKSGHFTPFLDDNTAHYTLSILEKNGINNARFDAIAESILVDKKILPKNFVGFRESSVLRTRLQDAHQQYEQKLGQSVKAVPSTAELKLAYPTVQRTSHVDVTSAAARTTNHAQRAAEARAIITYQAAYARAKDAALNPASNPVVTRPTPAPAPTTYPQALQHFSQSTAAVSSASATSSYPQALQRSFNAARGLDMHGYDAFGYDTWGRDRFGRDRYKSSFTTPSCLITSYTSCLSQSSTSYSWQTSSRSSVWDTYMQYVPAPKFTSQFERIYGISEYKLANMSYFSRLEFLRNQLDVTGLLSSYNSSVGYGACRGDGLSQIGGVATEAGVLEGLKNSTTHALLDEMIFALQTQDKKNPCTNLQLQQLLRELHQAIFIDETNPFFSLHFNNSSYMYPVMHPVFHNTLTGEIIATLDYWMKGFLNGGTFSLDFIRQWHKTANMEKNSLKANLIDLKAYCKQQGIEDYISLREMMHEAGLAGPDFDMSDDAGSPYKTKFKTSFRIIGYVKSAQGADGVLFFEPTFRVEHTLEPMPDYKMYLDNYFHEHGEYPEDYQKLQLIYERAKNQIANLMPRLPLFRDYFEMLKIIAQICYYYTTLKSMGKKPILPQIENVPAIETPKSYPPVPVRQYNYPKIQLSVKTIVEYFQAKAGANQTNLLDKVMLRMSETLQTDWDEQTQREIKEMIAQSIRQQLPLDAQSTPLDERKVLIVLKALHQHIVKTVQTQLHFQSETDDSDGFLITVKKIELTIGKKSLSETCQSKSTLREKTEFLIQSINEYEAAQLRLPLPAMPKEVIDSVRGQFEKAKNQLRASATAARSHYQSKLNDLPNELSAAESRMRNEIEQDARRQLGNAHGITEAGIDAKMRQIRSEIDSVVSQNAASIRAQGDRIRVELNSAQSATYAEESSKLAAIDQDFTNCIRNAFKEAMQHCRDAVKKSAEDTQYLSRVMKKNTDYGKTLLETYPISMLEFVDNNKIVGGCGLSLSKLVLQPISVNQRQVISHFHLTQGLPAENLVQSNNYWVFKIKTEDQTLAFDPSDLIQLKDISIEESRKLLDQHPDFIHLQDHNGVMPIHIAAMTGNAEGLSELSKRGADINRILPNGLTPLRMALQNRHEDAAITLLSMPAINISVQIDNGENPLHCAIEQELQKAALLFIQKGADLSQPRHADGLSAFHLAVQKGSIELVKVMLATKRVNVQSQTTNGQTALHIAAQKGNQEMVTFLLMQSATSIEDKQKKLPLSYAIAEIHEGVAIDLVNATTTQLNELLLLAAKKQLFSVCDGLIAKGASVNYFPSESDPRDYLYYLVKYGEKLRLQQLIEQKKDFKKTYYRHSLSSVAVKFGRMDIADLLIRHGVVLSAQVQAQWIQQAIVRDDIAIVRRWAQQVNIASEQLYLAVENNSVRCVSLLLPRFTEASLQNSRPRTHIMDAAIRSGEILMVEKMLPYCSDVNAVINAFNQSPLMLATALGDKKIIEKLLHSGADILKKITHQSALHEAVLNDDVDLLKFFETKIPVSEWPTDLSDFASQHKKQKAKRWLISKGMALTHVVAEPDSQSYPDMEAFVRMMLQPTEAVHRFLKMRIKVNEHDTVSLLRAGIDNEDSRVINLFMKHSFPHDARFDQGETKLHLAVRLNNADYLTTCLVHTGVDTAADNGMTPLMLASALGRAHMADILLEQGANPDKKNTLQQNALHMAIIEKHEAIAMQLIAASRAINSADREGDTALMCAAIGNLPKVLKALLKRGAKWDVRSEKGLTALHYAALAGFAKCVAILMDDAHADVNIQTATTDKSRDIKNTALHFAASQGHVETCQQLISCGADLLAENAEKMTPMDLCFANKTPACFELFISSSEFFKSGNQLNRYIVCCMHDNADGLRRLLALNADVTVIDEHGRNALHFAARHDANLCADILIQTGCAVDGLDNEGNTPLHIAAASGSVEVTHLLLKDQADANAINHEGKTPLIIAILNNHLSVVLALIQGGADLQLLSKQGAVPTIIALSKNLTEMATLLTILTQQILSQEDFVGEYQSLFLVATVQNWLRQMSGMFKQASELGDSVMHTAVRLDSPQAITLLGKAAPALFSAKNTVGDTPAVLAEKLKHTQSQCAIQLH